MEEGLLKILSEAGMGMGAMIALVIVVIYQMRLITAINESQGAMARSIEAMSENVKTNTEALRDLSDTVKTFKDTDRDMLKAIEYCRSNSRQITPAK